MPQLTSRWTTLWAVIGMALAAPGPAKAQVTLEVRGGLNVPTFDIADAAKAGPSFGAGLHVQVADRVWLMGDADFGFHPGADQPAGVSGPDVDVYHYMGKLGYQVYGSSNGKVSLILNAGAGAMTFKIDGSSSFTYPAINVGAKLIFDLGSKVSFVVSPQGDIAFSKQDERWNRQRVGLAVCRRPALQLLSHSLHNQIGARRQCEPRRHCEYWP